MFNNKYDTGTIVLVSSGRIEPISWPQKVNFKIWPMAIRSQVTRWPEYVVLQIIWCVCTRRKFWPLPHVSISIQSKVTSKGYNIDLITSVSARKWPFKGSHIQSCTGVINNNLIEHGSELFEQIWWVFEALSPGLEKNGWNYICASQWLKLIYASRWF